MADGIDAPDNSGEFVEIGTQEPPVGDVINPPEADEPDKPDEEAKPDSEKIPLRDDEGKFKSGVQARIDELTRRAHEAERRAAKAEADAVAARTRPDGAAPSARPTPDQFDDYGAFVEALTDWKVTESTAKRADDEARQSAESAGQARQAAWTARVADVAATIPDWDDTVGKSELPIAGHVATALMEADKGPELIHHLAQNPALATRLNEMSPARAAVELGRIEATMEAATTPPPKQSKAPAPISPVTPGPNTAKDPTKMNQAEYNRWRKDQGVNI